MALYRLSVKHRSRTTATAPAAQHVAYIMRDSEFGPAQAYVDYIVRQSEKVHAREDLVHTEVHNLPTWAHESPAAFFAAADQYERANGRTCTTWEVMLPRELTRDQQIATARDFLQTQFTDRHVYAWAMHESHASDGGVNPHIHVMFSERTLDGIDRNPEHFFKRYNREHPEQGGAEKDRVLNHRSAIDRQRQAYADVVNFQLERAGSDARLDPRSLAERGIDREPEARIPARQMAGVKRGRHVAAWEETLGARAAVQEGYNEENLQAAAYWEDRKAALGITTDAARETVLATITEQTHRPVVPEKRQSIDALRGHVHELEQTSEAALHRATQLHAAGMQVEAYARSGKAMSGAAALKIDTLLGQGIDLEDDAPFVGVRARLRERGRDGSGFGY